MVDERRAVPTRWDAALFWGKAWGLRAQRGLRNLRERPRRWPIQIGSDEIWQDAWAIRTPLWTEADEAEREFEMGKVENLRQAAARLHGLVVDVGGMFSFWRQVGRASRQRGFRVGRMLQQGCVVPAVGGGLCQLTNALYEAALRSGCEIVERHGHSVRMPNAPVHDATVAWNYVDLRFRARQAMRLAVRVEDGALSVAVQYREAAKFAPVVLEVLPESAAVGSAESCGSCGEVGCFRHEARRAVSERKSL